MPDPSPADASLADLEGPWAPGRTWSVLMLMLSPATGGGGGGGGVLEGTGSPSDLSPDVEALLHQVHALARSTTTLMIILSAGELGMEGIRSCRPGLGARELLTAPPGWGVGKMREVAPPEVRVIPVGRV